MCAYDLHKFGIYCVYEKDNENFLLGFEKYVVGIVIVRSGAYILLGLFDSIQNPLRSISHILLCALPLTLITNAQNMTDPKYMMQKVLLDAHTFLETIALHIRSSYILYQNAKLFSIRTSSVYNLVFKCKHYFMVVFRTEKLTQSKALVHANLFRLHYTMEMWNLSPIASDYTRQASMKFISRWLWLQVTDDGDGPKLFGLCYAPHSTMDNSILWG